jgi:hypothetical protein
MITDCGINIVLKVNDEEVCNLRAEYSGEVHTSKTSDGKVQETIRETSYCNKAIKAKIGGRFYVQAKYGVALHPL